MPHKEFKRIVPNAETAVLLIHGIAGTPNHFDFLLPLIPDDVSVYNMLLDGHGRGVRDFANTSMEKWETQVRTAVSELTASHDRVYIVAHSMGTLFAIEQAVGNPKVEKLFLMAAPLKLCLKPSMVSYSARVYLDRIDPNDPRAVAAKHCYGITGDKNPLPYLGWIPRYLELFGKIRKTRKLLPQLKTYCVLCQSCKDELVSIRSQMIFCGLENVTCKPLQNATHYYYPDEELQLLKAEFSALF